MNNEEKLKQENNFLKEMIRSYYVSEIERLKSIIKEVREKLLCYGETFDSKIHQEMQKELLEILERVDEE